MTKELGELCSEIGSSISAMRIKQESPGANVDLHDYLDCLERALDDYLDSLPKRSDAERAALMLLSAGQQLYGQAEPDCQGQVGNANWEAARDEAEKLLGIVELEPAK